MKPQISKLTAVVTSDVIRAGTETEEKGKDKRAKRKRVNNGVCGGEGSETRQGKGEEKTDEEKARGRKRTTFRPVEKLATAVLQRAEVEDVESTYNRAIGEERNGSKGRASKSDGGEGKRKKGGGKEREGKGRRER